MKRLTKAQGLKLLKSADLMEIGQRADEFRQCLHSSGVVSFVVDRNINYTNVCVNRCKFCAFWRDEKSSQGYVLNNKELYQKIDETIALGGTQILLQGGINPTLELDYYVSLLQDIKSRYKINIHGFSPPEVCYIADQSGLSVKDTVAILKEAGLDSMPGGGAEILTDRVRGILSPNKLGTKRWLDTMQEAHKQDMRTSATMMFGSVEKPEDIIEHLHCIRKLQDKTGGFTAFIPWPFQPGNTFYDGKITPATAADYLRVLALSRLYLDNIDNVQASWVTQGLKVAQVALRFGANDLGSTMIEENVVASAGVTNSASIDELIRAIKDAGFKAAQRDTVYNLIKKYR